PFLFSRAVYFASWNSGDGTQPSLPSSSLTFHQIFSFSPVGYSVIPGSRSRTTVDLVSGFSYSLPGFAIVTDCDTLSAFALSVMPFSSFTSLVYESTYATAMTWPISVLAYPLAPAAANAPKRP